MKTRLMTGLRPFGWLLAASLVAARIWAVDWPQYRGPTHDGVSTEAIRTDWAANPPKLVWKIPLPYALSSVSISGGQVFTQARRRLGGEEQEFCVGLDSQTGRELWATPLGLADYPHGGVGEDDGPRSTPAVDGDRVFVLTSYLRLACLNANTGQEIWSKDLTTEFGGYVIAWQNAASVSGDSLKKLQYVWQYVPALPISGKA